MMASQTWTEQLVEVAGLHVQMLQGGSGDPLLILHHDIGNPGWLPFYDVLARRFTVYVPSHPGFGKSERPQWMRNVRDLAIVYQWLLKKLDLDGVTLVGLGFGGWIGAEMATMSPRGFARLVLSGSAGILPPVGEILDQALLNHIDYARAGFFDQSRFDAVFGREPSIDQLEEWETNREMVFRVSWKPYMYSQTLPHLLGGVDAPALIVWGKEDRVVPLSCAERFAGLLPGARLEVLPDCGHCIDMEKPEDLARLVFDFAHLPNAFPN